MKRVHLDESQRVRPVRSIGERLRVRRAVRSVLQAGSIPVPPAESDSNLALGVARTDADFVPILYPSELVHRDLTCSEMP